MRVLALFALAAAQPKSGEGEVGDVDFGPGFGIPFTCMTADGNTTITPTLRVAVKRPEQSQGLMYIKTMDEEAGMVFLWPDAKKRVLYMRNTFVALDAGWFDVNGNLMQVSPLKPLDETWVWSSSETINFAVEMNLGWYEKHCPGSGSGGKLTMDMSVLADAVQKHGDDPAAFIPASFLPTQTESVASVVDPEAPQVGGHQALLAFLRRSD